MSSQFAVPAFQLAMEWPIGFPQGLKPAAVLPPNGTAESLPSRRGPWEPGKWKLPGVIPASRLADRPRPAMAASGVAAVDALTGGLPRGALTEICGAASSGRTSLLLAVMAQATARGEVIALVDTSDSFDPASAEAAGVELKRVLWVRCAQPCRMPNAERRMKTRNDSPFAPRHSALKKEYSAMEQALKVTDLLLQAGGFGMVIVDLGDIPEQAARRVPLASWFRFRRAVEHTDTVLVALTREACAKSCASLVLKLRADGRRLATGAKAHSNNDAGFTGLKPGASTVTHMGAWQSSASAAEIGNRKSTVGNEVTHAQLLQGLEIRAEVLRDAVQGKKPVQSAARFASKAEWQRKIG